jgi:hypothetical protein
MTIRLAPVLLGLSILTAGSSATAQPKPPGIAMCTSSDPARPLMTPMFMTNRTDQQELRKEWIRYTSATYGQDNPQSLGCNIYPWELRAAAQKNHASFPALMRSWRYPPPEVISWRPRGEAVNGEARMLAQLAGDAPTAASGVGSLTIEDDGIAARTKAWDNQLLQARREEAAAKVKRAIATEESKAEYDRLIAQVKADLKRRGRMQ